MTVEVRNSSGAIICMLNPLPANYACLGALLSSYLYPFHREWAGTLVLSATVKTKIPLDALFEVSSELNEDFIVHWLKLKRKEGVYSINPWNHSAVSKEEWNWERRKKNHLRLPLHLHTDTKERLYADKMDNVCPLDTIFGPFIFLETEWTKSVRPVRWSGNNGSCH